MSVAAEDWNEKWTKASEEVRRLLAEHYTNASLYEANTHATTRDSVELRALWNAARLDDYRQAFFQLRVCDARPETHGILSALFDARTLQRSEEAIRDAAELRAIWQASELPDDEAETLLRSIGARGKTVDLLRELFMLRRYWQKPAPPCDGKTGERIDTEAWPSCEWPGCIEAAVCSSGNFGGKLVCSHHFRRTNGEVSLPRV